MRVPVRGRRSPDGAGIAVTWAAPPAGTLRHCATGSVTRCHRGKVAPSSFRKVDFPTAAGAEEERGEPGCPGVSLGVPPSSGFWECGEFPLQIRGSWGEPGCPSIPASRNVG